MKLLVFANVPPPHHGQSYMVQLMLDGFGGDQRGQKGNATNPFDIECHHINAQFSRGLSDIGKFQGTKLIRLLLYCFEAIWCRFRYGVKCFYYVPAPGKRVALYRDWMVMLMCRPFFKKIILHWHAAGLGEWLESSASGLTRFITHRLLESVDLSIVLSKRNMADAQKLAPRRICVVNNGIPDPCPDFTQSVLTRRRSRLAARTRLLKGAQLDSGENIAVGDDVRTIKVLFLAHCTREKGVFDTLEGVALANAQLKGAGSPLQLQLTVAGEFVHQEDRDEFDRRVSELESRKLIQVKYLGFVNGNAKRDAFVASDCFCFPTYYPAEGFPLVVLEAMAFGLPVITTRWRSIPEMLPPDYPGFVEPGSPEQIAAALQRVVNMDLADSLREIFLRQFSLEQYLTRLSEVLHSVEKCASSSNSLRIGQ